MFNKESNKILGIISIVLLVIAVITVPDKRNRKNQSFDSQLSSFERTEVKQIMVYPLTSQDMITLELKDNEWKVSEGSEEYNADNAQVDQMLNILENLTAKRLASKSKDDWEKFEVTDSSATRVVVKGEKKVFSDIYFGKFSYKPAPQGSNQYQQQQGIMTTYVRKNGEKEVYAVDGFMNMTFNRPLPDYRDQNVTVLNKAAINRLTFSGQEGNFELLKQDKDWMLNGIIADSASMANYLNKIVRLRSRDFIDANQVPAGNPTHELTISLSSQEAPVHLSAFMVDSTFIALESSQNPGSFFNAAKTELFANAFKGQDYFLGK